MSKLKFCRLCLTKDVKMFDITGSRYQLLLDEYIDRNVNLQDSMATLACYLCYHQLKKYSHFLQRAKQADNLIRQLLTTDADYGFQQITSNLVVTPTTVYSVPDDEMPMVKIELEAIEEKPIEEEWVEEKPSVFSNDTQIENIQLNNNLQLDDIKFGSDSDDDVPLKKIKKKQVRNNKKEGGVTKRKVKKKKREREFKSDYAIEIILSREEQLKAMKERTTSMNYVNAAMKCETCCKGFVDTVAFKNHKKRHDESAGLYCCSVCSLRYRSRRQLRSHSVTAHARRYRCLRCSHLATTAHQARAHEKWHRGHLYGCKLCGDQFSKPTSYLTHLRKRHPSSQWCVDCGTGFISKRGLIMHRAKAHIAEEPKESDEPASERFCEECKVQFSSRLAWTRHVLTSVKHSLDSQDSTECQICAAKFPCKTSLALHRKEHLRAIQSEKISVPLDQAPMKLECEQCGALFVNKSKLQRHINRTHLGIKYDKNIVCEICSKKCTSNATLKYHQRIHTGEKPFECATCSKRFVDTNQLKIHTRTHTGEKPYCCNECGKRFTQKPALNRHHRVHTGAKPYSCQYCPKTFSQSNSMKTHTRAVHLKMPPNLKKNMIEVEIDIPKGEGLPEGIFP